MKLLCGGILVRNEEKEICELHWRQCKIVCYTWSIIIPNNIPTVINCHKSFNRKIFIPVLKSIIKYISTGLLVLQSD